MDENREIKLNGLKLIQMDSEVLPLYPENLDQTFIQPGQLNFVISRHFDSSAYVVAYLYSAVMVGKWEGGSFLFYEPEKFDEANILKLRVFNQNQELLVWKSRSTLKARLRKDDLNGNSCEAVKADHVLSGTKAEPLDNVWVRLTEDRGGVLDLPIRDSYVEPESTPEKRIHIHTYNYITENHNWQAIYTDCRFVGFTDGTDFIL